MRIRKHARILATPVSPSPTEPDTHVCQLNRSPWDVFALTQEYEHQAKIEEKYTCDSVGRKSTYAYDRFSEEDCFGSSSIASREELEDEDNDIMDKKYLAPCVKKGRKKKTGGRKDFDYIRCGKIDGKGWQCKKEAKQGEVLCEHHLIQLETYKHKYNYNYHSNRRIAKAKKTLAAKTKTVVVAANKKRNRKRVSSAPPDDFYFYCGFGPSRNKRRVQENEAKEKVGKEIIDAADHASSSSEVHLSNEFDRDHDNHDSDVVVDDFLYDDDDEDEDENGGKKRIRKPIKARSLKSLL